MLFRPSDTFLIESHVQHGRSHDKGIASKTRRNFMQYVPGYVLAYQNDCACKE